MLFRDILGLSHIKDHLVKSAEAGRIPHAQLFIGAEGTGTLPTAIAYAQYILCQNTGGDNDANTACNTKIRTLTHPDLHFAFPVANSDKATSHAISENYLEDWRSFVKEHPYGNLFDWYKKIGIEQKQGQIGVYEAENIVKKLSLKSYEGGFKILILWMAEKLNTSASNKLLKLIEEPPHKTVFILVTEEEEQLINTIKSRCQILQFPPLSEQVICDGLIANNIAADQAHKIAKEANGNYNKALKLAVNQEGYVVFESWFVQWVRTAFKAKGNKTVITDLLKWSEEIASAGREVQKQFLQYCITIFRQALLLNYGANKLVFTQMKTAGFQLEKFAPFVHENNIENIIDALEKAIYHTERNGNAKLIFNDLSINLTRHLHTKATTSKIE